MQNAPIKKRNEKKKVAKRKTMQEEKKLNKKLARKI